VTADATDRPQSAVVVNPSKVTDLDALRRTICGGLSRAGWPEPTWLETTPDDPGRGQAAKAVEAGAQLVFACGGDGTVMAVVTALAGTGVAMAVLPTGTGNLLATNLGLTADPAQGVEVVLQGGRRWLDVGVVEDKCFVVMAGMGFDAQMLAGTSETAKKRIGWIAYLGGAMRHLRDHPMRIRLNLDGGPTLSRRPRTVLVGNVGRLQGGVKLLTDGLLDVAVLTPHTLRHWAALGWAVLRHHPRVPRMETFTAKRVDIRSNQPQPRQLDGDLIAEGRTMTVTVRERALLLCVPQPERSPDLATGAEAAGEAAEEVRAAADDTP
jgi:diacylglycerol kinase family enzyme